MLEAKEIAKYFLSKDKEKELFNTKVIILNGRKCYEGLESYLKCKNIFLKPIVI